MKLMWGRLRLRRFEVAGIIRMRVVNMREPINSVIITYI